VTEIRLPKLNANDTTYTLVEWLAEPGAVLRAGDPVATVETSKAAEELPSPAGGVLHQLLPVGTECRVGELIGRLLDIAETPAVAPLPVEGEGPSIADVVITDTVITDTVITDTVITDTVIPDVVITDAARRFIDERGIDAVAVQALRRKIVRLRDLEAAFPASAGEDARTELIALSRVQQAVAQVVIESHRTVPPGFVAVKVALDAAIEHGKALTRAHRRLVGVPELVIAALGALLPRHPMCYSAPAGSGTVRRPRTADVGVTIDVGKGLHVPVLRDVAAAPIRQIAERLMELRTTALRGTFAAADLTGANIMLALHTDDDVTLAVPMVLPGTVCAVSLPGRQRELDLAEDGTPVWRTVVQLGAAYDHRVINGRDAVAYLRDLRDLLQYPERITGAVTDSA
jgi:2-oxoglutarate dehydrogenase E2 component (dihydrolipoamide succinyltransferase)